MATVFFRLQRKLVKMKVLKFKKTVLFAYAAAYAAGFAFLHDIRPLIL